MDGPTIHRYNAHTQPHKHPQLVTHSGGPTGVWGCGGISVRGDSSHKEEESVQVSRISEPPEAPRGLSASFKGQPL